MKVLMFQPNLVPLVLSGAKRSTWRLYDDKNLTVGDDIELRKLGERTSFAFATIVKVVEKPFSKMNADDKLGHETYDNDREMYRTYSSYYKTDVDENTVVKIIWFELA